MSKTTPIATASSALTRSKSSFIPPKQTARPSYRQPGLKVFLSACSGCRSCRRWGSRRNRARTTRRLTCRRASGRTVRGGGGRIINRAAIVIAPWAKQHQSASDHYRRNNGGNRTCSDSHLAVIEASPVIRCPGIESGPIVSTGLIIKIAHLSSPNADEEEPCDYRMVPTKLRVRRAMARLLPRVRLSRCKWRVSRPSHSTCHCSRGTHPASQTRLTVHRRSLPGDLRRLSAAIHDGHMATPKETPVVAPVTA
jgi:hypothetical protein